MELNEELIKNFAKEIEEGLPFHYTCDLLEISAPAAYMWLKQGESDKEHEVKSLACKFFTSIKKAYARFLKDSRNKIRNGEPGWQGVCWWLERTNKDFAANNDDGSNIEPVIVNPGVIKNEFKRK